MAAGGWSEIQGALREVWSDESLAELARDFNRQVVPLKPGTYTLKRKPWYRRIRSTMRQKVNDAREGVALKIAPWLDYHDDWD